MSKIKYEDTPKDVEEAFDYILKNNIQPMTADEFAKAVAKKQVKKRVNILLTESTIEKFKVAANKNGIKYQTMIREAFDTYAEKI